MLLRTLLALILAGCAAPAVEPTPAATTVAVAVVPSAAPTEVAMATPASATPAPASPVASCAPTTSRSRVKFGARSIPVDLAFTAATRTTGLSGRPCLAKDTGLVIGWDTPTPARIWMPDMNFAIDVIFVRDEQVVLVVADAQPCASRSDCPTFGPDTPIDYVLEVPAGSARGWNLKAGDRITLSK